MSLERGALLADATRRGASWCGAYTTQVDAWLGQLFDEAGVAGTPRVALVAVGGYGRAELCPQSDIDVMFVHEGGPEAGAVAERIWYPIWDTGLHLGHSVCTASQALGLASDDLHTATALLSARHVAGDRRITDALAHEAVTRWERRAKQALTELGMWVALHHEETGDVAFSLEPDLKDGRGGLRDVHALRWAEKARSVLTASDEQALSDAYAILLAVRVELQRATDRASNVLSLQDQDTVALALGYADADWLMRDVSHAARVISWTSDDAWRRLRTKLRGPLGRVSRRRVRLAPDLQLVDGELHLGTAATSEPGAALRAAATAADHAAVLDRDTLDRLAAATPVLRTWTGEARADFVALLTSGRAAIAVIEALDHHGIWTQVLPEWADVRARPQRNAYHRFTVDRHLLETAANAARLAGRVDRPDLLVTAALIHDLGKRGSGDHTEVGVVLAEGIVARMGWATADAETIVALVRHHLLLAEVATRRDLDDGATIERVADAVGTAERVHLLAALTEADAVATGPAAWSAWKAELVALLVDRVDHVLSKGEHAPDRADRFPTPAQLRQLAEGGRKIDASGDRVTVMSDDRPGTFSKVAGVLALHGLDVVGAAAHSTDAGRALSHFQVTKAPAGDRGGWERVVRDLELALDGRLALSARVAERAATYRRRHRHAVALHAPTVSFDNEASNSATIIDVHALDGVGVLYRITRALAELDLDIRSAKAETRGSVVTDAFYVRDGRGAKITDPNALAEITRAVIHGLGQ